MEIIVGLGNPGKKYENTKHNVGFMVLDYLAREQRLKWKENKKMNAWTCEYEDKLLAKPRTLMNNSGLSVQVLLSYYQLLPKKWKILPKQGADLTDTLTVIHDDADLPLGKYRVSQNSRSGGHKGIQSIIDHTKTQQFTRIRMGIYTPMKEKMPTPQFVLQRFSQEEKKTIEKLIPGVIEEHLKT